MNRISLLFVFVVSLVLSLPSVVQAQNIEHHPSPIRLLLHAEYDLSPEEPAGPKVVGHFVPAGNLVNGLAPRLFLGLNFEVMDWLRMEPLVAWDYKQDELYGSARFITKHGSVTTWSDFALQPGWDAYAFSQVEYILGFVQIGVEAEVYGELDQTETFSIGGGPNVLLVFSRQGDKGKQVPRFKVDLAGHLRSQRDENNERLVLPQFVARVHAFF